MKQPTNEWLREQYWEKGKSTRQIAGFLHVDKSTVGDWMRKCGIALRSVGKYSSAAQEDGNRHQSKDWLHDQYVTRQVSSVAIAEMCKVWPSTIRAWLRKFDIPVRSGGEAACVIWETKPEIYADHLDRVHASNKASCKGLSTVTVCCQVCGEPFEAHAPNVRKGMGKYCSRDCYGVWLSAHNRGDKAPGWQGGIDSNPYPPEFNRKFKGMVRKRDNDICVICLESGNEVHHIDYDKKNCHPNNLITVCMSCNIRANTNQEKWTAHYQAILSEKYGYEY